MLGLLCWSSCRRCGVKAAQASASLPTRAEAMRRPPPPHVEAMPRLLRRDARPHHNEREMEGASSTRGMQEREKAEAGRHEREKSGRDMFQGTHADEREQRVADIFPWQACRMNRTGWVRVRPYGAYHYRSII